MKGAKKVNEIYRQVAASNFSVILGTETSWDESISSEEVFGSRFNVFRDDRDKAVANKKSGGGVLIAISANYESEQISTSKCKEFDHVWVKSSIGNQVHIFATVYFPPENAKKESYLKFFTIAEQIISKFSPETNIHVYGDFNQRSVNFVIDDENDSLLIPIVGDNETLQCLFENSSEIGLNQVNHIRNESNSYLDLLFTNMTDDFCVTESLSPLWKNEKFHTAIEFSIFVHSTSVRPDDNFFEPSFDYKNANFELIKRKLNCIDWQTLIRDSNIDQGVDIFYRTIFDIIEQTVPKKRKKVNIHRVPVWYNHDIVNLKNRKQKAHKAYKRNRNDSNLAFYLSICDQLNLEIKRAHESHINKIESNIKSDPKSFYEYVKDKQKSNNFPSNMQLNEKVGNNSDDISNLFADFFQNIYTTHENNIRDYDYFSFLPEPTKDIAAENISPIEILQRLETLDPSKSAGPDGLPPVLLKSLSKELVKPLFWLFNSSLKSNYLPHIWKESFLVPIFKSGKKSDIKNYRGIAILSCIPKLFESIINDKIFSQVKCLITCNQHGFFKGRSTTTNLLQFVTFSINAMDREHYVETLYTDFSKAFDRVDIALLLFKLGRLGFNPGLLKWIQSYLSDRTQRVRFEHSISTKIIEVTSGVPQGSHLGPLLFILFVNDVERVLNRLNVLIYADDMKLFLEICNSADLVVFQNEIDVFHNWCQKNMLEINVKKFVSISFTRKYTVEPTAIYLNKIPVERCKQVRDLGIILDSKLCFNDHYNNIIYKASNKLGFIKRFSYHFNDPYTIKALYVTYVRPLLEYCSIVWAPYHETHINRIESVQKQFLLFALRKLGWTTLPLPSYESRCLLINLVGLKKRREFAMIAFINDVISQKVDSAVMLENLNFYAPTRQLRNRNLFYIKYQRTDYGINGPINRMMSCYNSYCEAIDITMNRSKLKHVFFSRYTRQ